MAQVLYGKSVDLTDGFPRNLQMGQNILLFAMEQDVFDHLSRYAYQNAMILNDRASRYLIGWKRGEMETFKQPEVTLKFLSPLVLLNFITWF